MGRGRAKAKQTKVARELKYSTSGTDLDRLRAELSGGAARETTGDSLAGEEHSVDEYDDPYAADDDKPDQRRTGPG